MAVRSQLEKRKAEIERELKSLREQLAEAEKLTPKQEIAEELHDVLCHSNHTDGCAWYYDDWNCKRGENDIRARYLKAASVILQVVDGNREKALRIVYALREI